MSHEDLTKKLTKLNVLDSLLQKDFINLDAARKGGKSEIVKEINGDIRSFLEDMMRRILDGGESDSGSNSFTANETSILKEFANRVNKKAILTLQPEMPLDPASPVHAERPLMQPEIRKESPVMTALKQHGFDPNAPVEERRKTIKNLEKSKKME